MPPFQLGFGYAAGRGRAGSGCAHSLEFFSQGPLLNFKENEREVQSLGDGRLQIHLSVVFSGGQMLCCRSGRSP